jgi:glutaredoxin
VIRLTIYSRPGCHLCEEMKAVVQRAVDASGADAAIDEVDISGHDNLEALYGVEVPVLMVDGKKAAKYRVAEDELRRMLNSRGMGRAGGVGGAGGAGGAGRAGKAGGSG